MPTTVRETMPGLSAVYKLNSDAVCALLLLDQDMGPAVETLASCLLGVKPVRTGPNRAALWSYPDSVKLACVLDALPPTRAMFRQAVEWGSDA